MLDFKRLFTKFQVNTIKKFEARFTRMYFTPISEQQGETNIE